MVSALSNALTYHEMFRHSDMVAMAAYTWAVSRGVLTGSTGDGVGFLPDGLVIKLFRDHLSERLPVTVSGHSPQRPFPGVVGIDTAQTPSGSPTYPLDVFAAIHPDRKTLTVSVVNPTASAQEFDLSVSGVELRGAGKLWRLAAPGVDATNVAGRKPVVEIVESAIGQAPARVSVPAVSISVYELELR
jgi:alpha-N-arabinofuranosidase